MNIYNVNKNEDSKNETHGHIDADAILTSLVEWFSKIWYFFC